jgi:lysyl-tRNA synthetase, class II
MASQGELRKTRLQKREKLQTLGINPYPGKSNRTHTLSEVSEGFDKLEDTNISVSGRIMSVRGQGAILFVDLFDGSSFQAVLKEDNQISYIEHDVDDAFVLFKETVDIGDFVEVKGKVFKTKTGQESIDVKEWKILSKALLPIPDSFYGIKDGDERFRKRYLDLLLNQESRDLLNKKEKFWEVTRAFLKEKGFKEVETPVLELTTGGAEATPFRTHHNDFDLDVYLRISVGELWQKRLMAAGFAKTFEIGKAFRNEGSSNEHVQEFTNMEFYWAFADYNDGMELTKEMYRRIAEEVFGTTKFETRGHQFDLSDKWKEIDYVDEVVKQTGINLLEASEEEMENKLKELKVEFDGKNKERLTDSLWKYCRKNISGPAFLVNHPKIVSPLSKSVDDNVNKTQRFQVLIAGSEIGNGYSELNNPTEQEKRFNEQQDLLKAGDNEAMMKDDEFVEMLEYGMPPTCGFGFGERLFAYLTDKSIREIQTFPLMKPRND